MYGEKIVEEKKKEATVQIMKYHTSGELQKLPQLKKWALVFAGDKCVVNNEIIL